MPARPHAAAPLLQRALAAWRRGPWSPASTPADAGARARVPPADRIGVFGLLVGDGRPHSRQNRL